MAGSLRGRAARRGARMKVVVSSDWHPDWNTHGVARFSEVREAAHRTVDAAIEEDAGLYVFCGDLCNPDRGSSVFRCVELAAEVALRLQEKGITSAWIAGNHDVIEDGTGDTSLSVLRAMAKFTELIHVFERPGFLRVVHATRGSASLIALPFTATSHAYDVEAALADLNAHFGPIHRETIIAGHLNIAGVVPGEESAEMARGREIWLPVEAAKRIGAHVVNGHYHRRQRTKDGVWIPGSLARFTFGEEGNQPSFMVLDTQAPGVRI